MKNLSRHGQGSFNPFLVRASVYCRIWASARKAATQICFNPFLVRASVYCLHEALGLTIAEGAEFQSLLSQGISLLLKEGAEGRRKWMDQWLNTQGLASCVVAFKKVWEQKNALLTKIKKKRISQAEGIKWMKSLNPLFVEKSIDLTRRRKQALRDIEGLFYQRAKALLYKKGGKALLPEELKLSYLEQKGGEEEVRGDKEGDLLQERVEQGLFKEVERGLCLYGAHREDFQICYKNKDSRYYASQGEQRAFLLALKQAQVQWICQFQDRPVVWLLDDVFSEIDKHLIQNLLHFIRSLCVQVILTSTYIPEFSDKDCLTVFFLKKGTLLRKYTK